MADVLKPLFSHREIQKTVRRLAREISRDYKGEEIVCVCILKGSFMFTSDLIRQIKAPLIIDFIRVSSYGTGMTSRGEITVTMDLETDVSGRHVLIVEDIIDSGLTLSWIRETLLARNAKSVKIVALVDKKARRVVDVPCEYVGFTIEDGFIVGYGIDYAEKYRNLRDIYVVEKE
ncbi:MAG: hypoxanthine phosphoribosyltransferase [candidate division WOR-3 bacterium]